MQCQEAPAATFDLLGIRDFFGEVAGEIKDQIAASRRLRRQVADDRRFAYSRDRLLQHVHPALRQLPDLLDLAGDVVAQLLPAEQLTQVGGRHVERERGVLLRRRLALFAQTRAQLPLEELQVALPDLGNVHRPIVVNG